jgi:uncharacterized protein YciI
MAYYALFYDVVDDFANKKLPFREQHLQLAHQAHTRGEVVLAGALADPAAALLIFKVNDRTQVESFARQDPYVTSGLVSRWEVRPWTVVIGNQPDN